MSKKEKKSQHKGGELSSANVADSRFSSLLDAPIFKKTSNQAHKVAVDERFQAMLTDDRFHIAPGEVVDSYGRKKKSKKGGDKDASELHQLYELEASTGKDDEGHEERGVAESKGEKSSSKSGKKSSMSMEERLDYLNKLSRGEVSEGSSSSDEDDDSSAYEVEPDDDEEDGEDGEDDVDFGKSPLDIPGDEEEDIEFGDATTRISILNCDWSHIKAQDLLVILQSFCPPGKQVKSVTVYPSDFGKERMALEDQVGPQGIWKRPGDDEEEEEDSEDEDEENEDLYEDIEDNELDEDDEAEEDEEEEDDESEGKGKAGGSQKYGDFSRKSGKVGIVLHDELQRRKQRHHDEDDDDDEEEDEEEDSEEEEGKRVASKPAKRSKAEESRDFDEIALRDYELSKLRYYFAIAECDCIETANILYEQLDDVELEDSAMALELRFVPDDLDLSSREVRDRCDAMPTQYKPPDFAVNALQHTKVKCTWDEGEADREQKLTNISAWRQLKDSDFQQYIASSDSDDSDEEEEEEEDEDEDGVGSYAGASMMSMSKKQKRAKSLRALLLGADAGSDAEQDDDDDDNLLSKSSKKKAADDFFIDDNQDEGEDDEEGEMVMTYIPEAGKELLDKKREKEQELTPYELDLKKSADISKARKEAKKAYVQSKIEEQERLAEEVSAIKSKKNKPETAEEKAKKAKEIAKLQDIMGDRLGQDDRLGSTVEKKKHKKDKKRGKQSDAAAEEDEKVHKADKIGNNFSIDVADDRFKRVFEGDSAFGIDRTAHEFKQTPGMKKILDEQRKNRNKKESNPSSSSSSSNHNKASAAPVEASSKQEMNQLVNRLKRKFNQ